MADFTIGGKGFDGIVVEFSTVCIKEIDINANAEWVDFSIDGNTIRMNVDTYDGAYGESRSCTVTINYDAYVNAESESITSCTKSFTVEQLSKNFDPSTHGESDPPEPGKCKYFIVDSDDVELDDNGSYTMCDSAFIITDSAIPVFEPSTGSTWVSTRFLHWDVISDRGGMCSDYGRYPCVAESLMRHAGISTSPKPQICKDDPDHASITQMPQVVQDAINCQPGSYCHELGTIEYIIDSNESSEPRSCTITWYIDNSECKSTTFTIYQPGTGGGGGGCDVSLKIEGLKDDDKSTIDWGDDNKTENVGNGTYSHTYEKGFKHTFKVTADDYTEVNGTFNCSSESEKYSTATMVETSDTGCSSCSVIHLYNVPTEITLDSTAGCEIEYPYTTDGGCTIRVQNNCSDWLDVEVSLEKIKFKTKSNATAEKSGKVYIKDGTGKDCKSITVTQSKPECINPGGVIDIMLDEAWFPYDGVYYLTNNEIGTNCADKIRIEGNSIEGFPGMPLAIASYVYPPGKCDDPTISIKYGMNYNEISSPGSLNCDLVVKVLDPNKPYYIYCFIGDDVRQIGRFSFPNGNDLQNLCENQETCKNTNTYRIKK